MKIGAIALILFVAPTWVACQKAETSRVASMVGAANLRLLSAEEKPRLPLASAVGALSEAEIFEEAEEFSELSSLCTGVQISPRLVLTAKHCTSERFVFDPFNIAGTGEEAKFRFKNFGSLLRAMFYGDLVPESKTALKYRSEKAAVYKSESYDFAIWKFEDLSASDFVDIRRYSLDWEKLGLYGHPNGIPLSLAENCSGRSLAGKARVFHDCDSLNGSSGGLLFDRKSGLPVGLHTTGSGGNDGEYYKEKGHFESVEELALHCDAPECAGAEGYNQALPFPLIIEDIVKHSPDLADELHLSETSCVN